MVFEIDLKGWVMKAAVVLTALVVISLLLFVASVSFAVGLLSDQRTRPPQKLLADGVNYVPNSAALLGRLAETEMRDQSRDLSAVEAHAQRAVNISPNDYRRRLLLATIEEAKGDRLAAEKSLHQAVALAPNYTDVHWRLANLLLRQNKVDESLDHFVKATSANPSLLPLTLDLLWRVSGGKLAAVEAVTGDPKSRFTLAQFLLNQSRVPEAVQVFAEIDRESALAMPESSGFLNSLMTGGHLVEARELWADIVGDERPGRVLPGISNNSFESDITKGFEQFGWTIGRNDYAVASIDPGVARTGSRSLRIDFLGRDTTRLDGQVRQMILVTPGARYRIECYVKSEKLVTPEGPRVVVTDTTSSAEIASSEPIASGSSDWGRIVFDFAVPPSARAVGLIIKRVPKFSFDEPTRGVVWFDDFSVTEQK
jgi:hypothetical protein